MAGCGSTRLRCAAHSWDSRPRRAVSRPLAVIASEAKQSSLPTRCCGLLRFARNDAYNVPGMNQHTAEDIVRRATAAFNSGKPEEARRLCEQGLSRQPGDPILHHLLAAVLFSQAKIQPAATHVEMSLAKRPGHAAAHLLAARIARAAKDFD